MRRVIEYFRDNNLARLRVPPFFLRNQNTVRQFRIIGHDNADAALPNKLARDLLQSPLKHINQFPLGATASIQTDQTSRVNHGSASKPT